MRRHGHARILRFGEKGLLWLTVKASGKGSHAAHVHKGDCAIERLVRVMEEFRALRSLTPDAPIEVTRAIDEASSVSESKSGPGETAVLKGVTVTFGTVRGGRLANLVADGAEMTIDIRLPVGISVNDVQCRVEEIIARHEQVTVAIDKRHEPTWTRPDDEIMRVVASSCAEVLKVEPVINMRIGASDARLYRQAGIPSVVCGLTPFNVGAADEYVKIDELKALGEVFALSAFDFLNRQAPHGADLKFGAA